VANRLTREIRAAVLREPGRAVSTETVTLDAPHDDEVLVRVAAAGVCRSDLHFADGALGDGRWPMVLGHEGAGVVEEVGARVTHLAPGGPRRLLLRPLLRHVPLLPRGTRESLRACGTRRAARDAAGRNVAAPRSPALPADLVLRGVRRRLGRRRDSIA
jgi:hypothetical protein